MLVKVLKYATKKETNKFLVKTIMHKHCVCTHTDTRIHTHTYTLEDYFAIFVAIMYKKIIIKLPVEATIKIHTFKCYSDIFSIRQ